MYGFSSRGMQTTRGKSKAIYNRLVHIHSLLVDLYSSCLCLKEIPIVKCNESWSSKKLSISINISTEWAEKCILTYGSTSFMKKTVDVVLKINEKVILP